MAKKKQKYYVVWQGVEPGIYDSWTDCQLQINGFAGARYKSFSTLAEARVAFGDQAEEHIGKKKKQKRSNKPTIPVDVIIKNSLSVDAACSGSPGIMEYRGVWTEDGTEVFRKGPFDYATNNVGEFLALVHGISWLQRRGMHEMVIYSDSRTAMAWLRNKKVKTTLKRKKINEDVFKLLDRAEKWAQEKSWSNQVIKWETSSWGEIPADFGRK